jgi:hypothetical protein
MRPNLPSAGNMGGIDRPGNVAPATRAIAGRGTGAPTPADMLGLALRAADGLAEGVGER